MKVKTITYQRVKNLGNYESERLEMSAELEDNDNIELQVKILQTQVLRSLGLLDEEKQDDDF